MLQKEYQLLLNECIQYTKILVGNDIVSYFESNPSAEKTLVLLHGFGGTGLSFINLMKRLTDINVIAVDLPGRGESTVRDSIEDYQPQQMAEWVKAFVDTIGLLEFHMGAHSMSAHYMFEYAANYPLLSCISIDGGYISPSHMESYSLKKELENTRKHIETLNYESIENYFEESQKQGMSYEKALINKRCFKEVSDRLEFDMSVETSLNYIEGSSNYPDYQLFEKVNQPILLIRATLPESANEIREQGVNEILKHKPIEVKVIGDSTHLIYDSQFETTAQFIEDWIKDK